MDRHPTDGSTHRPRAGREPADSPPPDRASPDWWRLPGPRLDRPRAHLALITHAPIRDWRWLWLRRRCRFCGRRYPCPARRTALDLLTEGMRPA